MSSMIAFRTRRSKKAGRCLTTPERWKGVKIERDLINAKDGSVVAEAGKKLTARGAKKIAEDGVKDLLLSEEEMIGRLLCF